MSIRNIRFKKLLDDITHQAIQDGYVPSSYDVIQKANDYIFSNDINMPSYEYKYTKRRALADSSSYNAALDAIYNDFDILYKIAESNSVAVGTSSVGMSAMRNRLSYEIGCIQNDIETIIALYNNKGITDCLYDTFDDMSKIQSITGIMDHGVKLNSILSQSVQVPIKYITSTAKITHGTLSDVISNDAHFAWIAEDESIKITLGIDNYINALNLDISQCNAYITYSDGRNVLQLPYTDMNLRKSYIFPRMYVHELYIELFNGSYRVNSIKVLDAAYKDEGEIVSVPMTTDKAITKISLSVDADTYDGTSIDYYINLDNEWIPISALEDKAPRYKQVIDLLNAETAKQYYKFDTSKSEAEYEMASMRYNGIRFYKLGTADHTPYNDVMYKGKDAMYLDGIPTPYDGNSIHITGSHATFYIYCETPHVFNAIPISNKPASIKINDAYICNNIILGAQIMPINLSKGWNSIDITTDNGSVDLGFKANDYGVMYMENVPMERVDVLDLQRKVPRGDTTKFAVSDNAIIVSHYIPGITYEHTYNFTVKNIHTVQFKAVLHRNGSTTSPVLKKYYINII